MKFFIAVLSLILLSCGKEPPQDLKISFSIDEEALITQSSAVSNNYGELIKAKINSDTNLIEILLSVPFPKRMSDSSLSGGLHHRYTIEKKGKEYILKRGELFISSDKNLLKIIDVFTKLSSETLLVMKNTG